MRGYCRNRMGWLQSIWRDYARNVRRKALILAVLIALGLAGVAVYYFWPAQEEEVGGTVSLTDVLAGDAEGFLRADEHREFAFPQDHGPHPGYRSEWWYFTGNLEALSGERFGYQFTIFRNRLTPPDTLEEAHVSDWATDQLYLGHFAVADLQSEEHVAFERLSRGAVGLAGAEASPFRVWLEDWSVESTGEETMPVRIRANDQGAAVNLTVTPLKPEVLQGEEGYDRKGPEPGDASYYISFTRLATEGTVTIGEETFEVEGLSWMDHEWSTSALAEEQVGWDWFSLQLSNETDLMYYQLREEDGDVSPFTTGSVVAPDGASRTLSREEVGLEVLEEWTSPESGGTYPIEWRLQVPSEELDLTISAAFPDQEMNVSIRYWEGAVSLEGTHRGEAVTGEGYVEMTGYAEIFER